MNNAEIQIQFPTPGEWDKINMTAVYQDADGYTRTNSYTQDNIPADQAPALAAVVAALVGLSEPWQASQVWARLGYAFDLNLGLVFDHECPLGRVEFVELLVEAINSKGGRRKFTMWDYPELGIPAPAAVAFFKHFTNTNQ